MGQLSPCTTTAESVLWSPGAATPEPTCRNCRSLYTLESLLHDKRRHHSEKPATTTREEPPACGNQRKAGAAIKTQHSQKLIHSKIIIMQCLKMCFFLKRVWSESVWPVMNYECFQQIVDRVCSATNSWEISFHNCITLLWYHSLESEFTGENTNLIAKLYLASFQHTCKVLIIMGIMLVARRSYPCELTN